MSYLSKDYKHWNGASKENKKVIILYCNYLTNLEGKAGGAFGAFGWSGEAPGRIFDTMENIFKMEMVSGPLRLKSASLGGGVQMAQDYGKEIAKNI